MYKCDYCEVAKKARQFLPKRVTKSKDSIKRYVGKIYAKYPTGVPNDSEDFPKSFQGWMYKEHKKIICWSCAVRTSTDKSFKEKVFRWIKEEEAKRLESMIESTKRKKPAKKMPAKPKKSKSAKKVPAKRKKPAGIRIYEPFEIAVNDVVIAIRELEKYWNSSIIIDKNRSKALKYINRSLRSLNEEKEERFKV